MEDCASIVVAFVYLLRFTVFIHSATNVTLDITFTSYITFLTYNSGIAEYVPPIITSLCV